MFHKDLHRLFVEEEVDGGGEAHLGRVGLHVVDDGAEGAEIDAAEFGAHVNGAATPRDAIGFAEGDDVARQLGVFQFLQRGGPEALVLLVEVNVALCGDVFRIVELVFGGAEAGVDTPRGIGGGDGHHHLPVVHILGFAVDLNHHMVGIHLIHDAHTGIFYGVAVVNQLHTADEGEELIGTVELGTAIETEVRTELEVAGEGNLGDTLGGLIVPYRVEVQHLHLLVHIHIVVIAAGAEVISMHDVDSTVI